QLHYGSTADDVTNGLVLAGCYFFVIVGLFLPESHRESDSRGQILLSHHASGRAGRADFGNRRVVHRPKAVQPTCRCSTASTQGTLQASSPGGVLPFCRVRRL